MKKVNYLLLPLLAMQDDGSDAPNRHKDFVDSLGLSEDIASKLANNEIPIADVKQAFISNFETLTQNKFREAWEQQNKNNLIKTTQTGTHNALQTKLAKAFGLDVEKFKDADKPTAAMIEAISGQIETLKGQNQQGSEDLRKLLDTANTQISELTPEIERLREIEKSIPELEAKWKQNFESEMWLTAHIDKAIEEIENKHPLADKGTIKAVLNTIADISVVVGEDGQRKEVIKNKSGKPFQSTDTDYYKSTKNLILKEVLEKKGWITKQNPTAGNPPNNNNNNQPPTPNGWPTGGMMGMGKK